MQIRVASGSEFIATAASVLAVPQGNPQHGDICLLAVTSNLL